MIKRKRLGQHFLNSNSIAQSIVFEAKITRMDTVFEIGTGLGILTPLLCTHAHKVISVDVDENLVNKARFEFSNLDNLVLKLGDGFRQRDAFSIFVSNLPYSKSSQFVAIRVRKPTTRSSTMAAPRPWTHPKAPNLSLQIPHPQSSP